MHTERMEPEPFAELAAISGRPVEFTHDAAFLTLGDTEFYAILPAAGR